ncbi:hypothetical protein SDC9_126244 [bioreactor metagenome]|uniref:Uncharacterized protein n=1 Tax=bioreactor metagenome TaxID=1076179 RepID=A0A645CQL0_9ZZZZ
MVEHIGFIDVFKQQRWHEQAEAQTVHLPHGGPVNHLASSDQNADSHEQCQRKNDAQRRQKVFKHGKTSPLRNTSKAP